MRARQVRSLAAPRYVACSCPFRSMSAIVGMAATPYASAVSSSAKAAWRASPGARWSMNIPTCTFATLGSSRLAHALVQAEIETFAIEPSGEVAWRVAHSDVVTGVELVGGRLVLTSFDGQVRAIDPRTGRGIG